MASRKRQLTHRCAYCLFDLSILPCHCHVQLGVQRYIWEAQLRVPSIFMSSSVSAPATPRSPHQPELRTWAEKSGSVHSITSWTSWDALEKDEVVVPRFEIPAAFTLLVLAQISEAGRDGAATNNKMHGSSWSVTSLIDNCPI